MNDDKTAGQKGKAMLRLKIAVLAPAVFVLIAFFYVITQKTVVLDVDGDQITLRTFSTTVGDMLLEQGVTLLEKDEVSPSVDTIMHKKTLVTVHRATELTILADGQETPVRTMKERVADVLEEYNIGIEPLDVVEPALESPVEQGMTVQVARVRTENIACDVPVKYEIQREYTVSLPSGSSRVTREGKEGKERQTWQITYRDGVEMLRQMIGQEVLEKPVDQILLCGSGTTVSRGGENIRFSRSINMQATAYTHTGRNTATGVPPQYGTAAVDTSVIPFGTDLYVDGYGYAKAMDRGSAIKGNKIDLFFETYEETAVWGKRWVDVYILD